MPRSDRRQGSASSPLRKRTRILRHLSVACRLNARDAGDHPFPFCLRKFATVARAAARTLAGASVTTALVLVLQLAWVALRTPRLPPPPLSGADFVAGGRSVATGDVDDEDVRGREENDSGSASRPRNEVRSVPRGDRGDFRLVLVGDSPVEGIGNSRHEQALAGRTARAFLGAARRGGHDRVRYWSYGKSGLTARGVEEEMLPYLRRVAEQHRSHRGRGVDDCDRGNSSEPPIHAVVLLCGVNNVLDPRSNMSSFRSEVCSLLKSIRSCHQGLESTPLIVLGLPDFSRLPFLPWPLSLALGLRGRRMQMSLESAVAEFQEEEKAELMSDRRGRIKTILVNIPEVRDVLGTIGYYCHDGQCEDDAAGEFEVTKGIDCPLKMRHCHRLLDRLGKDASLNQKMLASLQMADFLCEDGFHPGRYGTVYIGNLIAEAYSKLERMSADRRCNMKA